MNNNLIIYKYIENIINYMYFAVTDEEQKCFQFYIAVFHSQLWALSWEWETTIINWIQFHIDKIDPIKINLLAQQATFVVPFQSAMREMGRRLNLLLL